MNPPNHFSHRLFVGIISFLLLSASQVAMVAAQNENALAGADAALFNGDYESAINAYNAAVNDPALRCPALYGLGVTYLRAAQYQNADATFTPYLTECETSFRGLVMRGETRQQMGLASEALADYEQAIALNPGVLDSYLYERIATLNPDQSVYYLRLSAEAPRHPEGSFVQREKLAGIYALVGSPAAALTQYNALLVEIDVYLRNLASVEGAEFDRNGGLRARIELEAANIELESRPTGRCLCPFTTYHHHLFGNRFGITSADSAGDG